MTDAPISRTKAPSPILNGFYKILLLPTRRQVCRSRGKPSTASGAGLRQSDWHARQTVALNALVA